MTYLQRPGKHIQVLYRGGSFFGIRPFSFTGLAFYRDRLFAGTDRGLFEIVDGKLVRRFDWSGRNDVIEELFFDRVNNCLWLRIPTIEKFVRYDGEHWSFIELPETFGTRGESLHGFRMFNSDSRLYIHSSWAIWEWDDPGSKWRPVSLPDINCSGEKPGEPPVCFVDATATENMLFAVFRKGTTARLESMLTDQPGENESDYLLYRNGDTWEQIPNELGKFFFVKEVAGGHGGAYLLSTKNELFSVSSRGFTELPSPGEIESIASSTTGNLLVSVKNGSVFEFTTTWENRAGIDLQTTVPRTFVGMTEDKGKIAYSRSYSNGSERRDCNIGQETSLWIIEDGNAQCVGESAQ